MSDDGKSCATNLYSDKYKKNILKYNSVEDDSTYRTFDIEKYGEKKNIDYTYDSSGNPKEYYNGMSFNWYMYDSGNNVIGFEYSQLSEINETLKTTRIYYEKNLQGDVTGLLDARGAEIASYIYDAWGNVITDTEKSFCYEGYEVPFELNHVLYRGYYYDGSCTDTESDTNLYYLQSRYYDAEVGRFINADDVKYLDVSESEVSKDNLYVYCNSNPINNIDPEGNLIILIRVRVYWKKSYKQRKNEYFTKVLSGWYKTDDFESITLNTGYSISASVSSELGVSAEVVTAKVGLGSSCTIFSTASGTHKIKKKKGMVFIY